MEYYYNIDNHVLVVSKVEANNMDDSINKGSYIRNNTKIR